MSILRRFFSFVAKFLTYGSAFVSILGFIMAFVYPDKFGDIVGALKQSGEKVTEAVEEASEDLQVAIEAATDAASGAKREVSNDPIKELVNRGYTYDQTGFMRALTSGDTVSLDLFCGSSGARFVSTGSMFFVPDQNTRRQITKEAWELYLQCSVVDFDEMCADSIYNNAFVCRTNFDEASFISVCGKARLSELRRKIQDTVSTVSHPDDVRFWNGFCGAEQVNDWRK